MVSKYWDGSDDSSRGEPDDEPKVPERAGTTDDGDTDTAAAGTPDEESERRLRTALSRVVLDDTAGWRRALIDAGFSEAESGRLIFERLRPRDEGRSRVGQS